MFGHCVRIWQVFQAASFTAKAVLFLTTGGFAVVTAFVAEWASALFVIGSFTLVVVIFGVIVFISLPVGKGIHTPRHLRWYKNPLRRVSFDFDNYLGLSARAREDVRLGSFQAQMKINWGKDLRPKEAFIRSRNSGEKALVRFRAREGYKEASDIEFIPKGRNYRMVADFENLKEPGETIPIEGFLQNFSGFEFVVEWDGGRFARTFPRSEIDCIVSSFRQYSNPAPARQIVTKDRSDYG